MLPKARKRSYEDIKMEFNERMHDSERVASQEIEHGGNM
jgi:hypothetical protein